MWYVHEQGNAEKYGQQSEDMSTKDDKEKKDISSSIGIGIHWFSIFMSVRFVREFVLNT
jgi:hypothetical protein